MRRIRGLLPSSIRRCAHDQRSVIPISSGPFSAFESGPVGRAFLATPPITKSRFLCFVLFAVFSFAIRKAHTKRGSEIIGDNRSVRAGREIPNHGRKNWFRVRADRSCDQAAPCADALALRKDKDMEIGAALFCRRLK